MVITFRKLEVSVRSDDNGADSDDNGSDRYDRWDYPLRVAQ